ncbi:MAG: hypothetical protein ACK466_11845, partial [Pseudanabaena sp.]
FRNMVVLQGNFLVIVLGALRAPNKKKKCENKKNLWVYNKRKTQNNSVLCAYFKPTNFFDSQTFYLCCGHDAPATQLLKNYLAALPYF